MIKLMLVEDESSIRNGIRNSLPWENHDLTICGEAQNGAEALKLIPQLKPDILLLDIRMPVLDGIGVLEKLTTEQLDVKVIILSGYDDFSYVQQALRYGASDYLLKPCNPRDLLDTILAVKDSITEERQQKHYLKRMKPMMEKSMPLLREKYLSYILMGQHYNYNNVIRDFNNYKLNLSPHHIQVAVVKPDDYNESEDLFGKETDLINFAISNIIEEILSKKYTFEIIPLQGHIIILSSVEDHQYCSYTQVLERSLEKIKDYLKFTVSIGLGNTYKDIKHAEKSYKEACSALTNRFWTGHNALIEFNGSPASIKDVSTYPIDDEKDILNMISSNIMDDNEINRALIGFFSNFLPNETPIDFVIQSGITLALSISHYYMTHCYDNTANHIFPYIDTVRSCETLDKLHHSLMDMMKFVITSIHQRPPKHPLVNAAIEYINSHYSDDIGLEIVADEIHTSPSYLSKIFKKYMQTNFLEYLHKKRIKEACNLINLDPWMKGYELASAVGYKDEGYFYKVFKKVMLMTPTQYKKHITLK